MYIHKYHAAKARDRLRRRLASVILAVATAFCAIRFQWKRIHASRASTLRQNTTAAVRARLEKKTIYHK